MPYTITPHANHTVEVAAHLEADAVHSERQAIAKTLRHRANVPGFRRGKAPLSLVQARFAEEIRDELQEHLTQVLWREIIDGEERFEPLTAPSIKEAEFGEDGGFHFSAEVEVRPNYEIPPTDNLSLPEFSLEVSQEDLDEELEKLRQEQATWEPADDSPAEDGMLVEADLHGEISDGEGEPYSETNARFVVGAEGIPREVSEALQGARPGDERVAERTFPEDDEKQERAGKTVRYSISVKEVKRKVLPDLDDELAAGIGLESLEALEERVREALRAQKLAERRSSWRRALLDELQAGLDVNDLPSSLVQSSVKEEMHRFAYSMAMQGMAPDSGEVNWQELAARFEPAARKKVLDSLVLEQLAQAWEIEAPEEDVDAYVRSEAQQRSIPPAEHKANLAKEDKLEGIRYAVRISATVDELIRRAGGEV